MTKYIVIVEKKSARENFARALGGTEGTLPDGSEYVLSLPLNGHTMTLPEPIKVAKAGCEDKIGGFRDVDVLPWSYDDFDFKKKVFISAAKRDVVMNIKTYLDNGYVPVVATDRDSSGNGDLIGMEILDILNYNGPIMRDEHASEEEADIQYSMSHLRPITRNHIPYLRAKVRQEMDFMSQSLTRLAAKSLSEDGYRISAPRIGGLQSVMLLSVYKQLEAIRQYKPSSVYESRYKFGDLSLMHKGEDQYPDEATWTASVSLPETSAVRLVSKKPVSSAPGKPHTLDSISGESAKIGISGSDVLPLIQAMYDNKYLSYPRPDARMVMEEEFDKSLGKLDDVLTLLELPKELFTHRQARFKTHVVPTPKTDKEKENSKISHGALRFGSKVPKDLLELDKQFGKGASALYRVICEAYVAMFLEDTEYMQYKYETTDTPYPFTGSLRLVTKQGGMDAEADVSDVATTLPDVTSRATLYGHEVKSKKPTAPTRKWLADLLERENIGTPATRVPTLDRMVASNGDRQALVETKGKLTLTPLGVISARFAEQLSFVTVDGRHIFINALDDIHSEADLDAVRQKILELLDEDVMTMKTAKVDASDLSVNRSYVAEYHGERITLPRVFAGHEFTTGEFEKLLADEEISFDGVTKKKEKMTFVVRIGDNEYESNVRKGIVLVRALKAGRIPCEWDGKQMSYKGSYGSHEFTKLENDKLQKGEEITFVMHSDNGDSTEVTGKLMLQTFVNDKNELIEYLGFKVTNKSGYIFGTWQGREISYKGKYGSHVFTEAENEALLRDEKITFQFTAPNGDTIPITGKLMDQVFITDDKREIRYVGFKAERPDNPDYVRGMWHGKEVSVKRLFADYRFSDEEMEKLFRDEYVTITFTAKSGNEMTVTGKLSLQTYQGHSSVRYTPEFDNKKGKNDGVL